MTNCLDCLNIIQTLDEVKQNISKISDEDLRTEVSYDFENATEHIIEWFRHNIRAAQQDSEKTRIISEMGNDEAFCTFDWGQKILPQDYRESQKKYFGKKGMSVLIGSFIWKNEAASSNKKRTTTDIQSESTFSSQSYIVALTTAAQTELDTLSGGELILKQFKSDFPHITKLHKRTDNAGNFSSHATPEAERLICQKNEIELLTRDYSEVQKGKDICDRVCGVCKNCMRSWIATGNDLSNAHDIKEGMQYAGGVKNTKIATAEIIPGVGHLDKTNIPNVSLVRSVRYERKAMKVRKASNIGTGISIKYKAVKFENNMRLTSSFDESINKQSSRPTPKRKNERRYYDLVLCPVNGCTCTFESDVELHEHIASNSHTVPEQVPRTANDVARLHLTEMVRTTRSQTKAKAAQQQQQHSSTYDLTTSLHNEFFSHCGWGLRTRKLSKPMSDNVKHFLEGIWLDSIKTNSRIIPENIQQQIRMKRDQAGKKHFQINEYPSKNQIQYHCRKLSAKYAVGAKQQLIDELIDENIEPPNNNNKN
ncbi:unnamed protein product [Adineta steineri]|uniref:C2H2-type domain-containing protein n=1 Tax=Adineta steineri TaxID=433720 RepID=A0A819WPB4_9BILA|nr:unnamed protein product [Adineta steineri]